MSTKEQIEVLQAYENGKRIVKNAGTWRCVVFTNRNSPNHAFNFQENTYGVVKEKYKPFKNAEEALSASKLHGPYVISDEIYAVPKFTDSSIIVNGHKAGFDELLHSDIKWQDGTIIGALEN